MNYHKQYELLIDLPTGEKKGDRFLYHDTVEGKVWYEVGAKYCPREGEVHWLPECGGVKLRLDQMTLPFFKPIGDPKPFYPPFPDKDKIKEFYHLIGESKYHSIDEIRAINPIFESDEYWDGCYELLKRMYEQKYFKSNLDPSDKSVVVDLWDAFGQDQTVIVYRHPAGVFYEGQCGGSLCTHPRVEGYAMRFIGFDFNSHRFGCYEINTNQALKRNLANAIDDLIGISFDWDYIDDVQEGFIPVIYNGKKAVIFSENCD